MAIIGFIYQPVEPPNKWERQSDSENGWHEMEWMDLARMPRFWPGFIEAFLQKPDVRSDMIKYFAELENISESKINELVTDETPKAAPSRIEFNHNTLKQLAKALGVDLKFVINRREV
mgnify:CR=1 FL=1